MTVCSLRSIETLEQPALVPGHEVFCPFDGWVAPVETEVLDEIAELAKRFEQVVVLPVPRRGGHVS